MSVRYKPKHARRLIYRGRHAAFRPWRTTRLVVSSALVLALSKANTGEFPAITREAEITPPPWYVHVEKPPRALLTLPPRKKPPKPKPKPRPPKPPPKPVLRVRPKPIIETSYRKREHVLMRARTLLGIPYVYGGDSFDGVDCSGFTLLAYRSVGLSLPHHADDQPRYGRRVLKPLPGDLVHWDGHVGIYYGNGQVIGARHQGTVSQIYSLYGSPTYYRMV